jgi:hypothetical protein
MNGDPNAPKASENLDLSGKESAPKVEDGGPIVRAVLDLSGKESPPPEQDIPYNTVDPTLILKFAKEIVLGCAVVGTVFALVALICPPLLVCKGGTSPNEIEKYILSTGTSLLSVVTTVIPPIVTLVLGFYFGKKDR